MVWQNINILRLDKQINHLYNQRKSLYNSYYYQLIRYEKNRNSYKVKNFALKNLNMKATNKKDFIFLGKDAKNTILNSISNKQVLLDEKG